MFSIGFLTIGLVDLVDILVITYIFYKVFVLLRGTRAAPMVVGLIVLLGATVIAQRTDMVGLGWLLSQLKTVWLVALVIVFQAELRRLLAHLGQTRLLRLFFSAAERRVVDEVVDAAVALSSRGLGALIAITRDTGIAGIVETGVPLHADVGAELLVSLFVPRSPLHDGAVVVTGDQIEAARCILPLTQRDVARHLGTRHRAAIGLSEETDAITVIVSEETSAIGVAVDGQLTENLTPKSLRQKLRQHLQPATQDKG